MIPKINREKSWLLFNERVLQEAQDKTVPIIERIKFIGIFSNNLDEFFRIRYAYIRRISLSGKSGKKEFGMPASELLKDVTKIVDHQQEEARKTLNSLIIDLEKDKIFIINEKTALKSQHTFLREFFISKVAPTLMTIMLDQIKDFPHLKDEAIYLAIEMSKTDKENDKKKFSLIEIPVSTHGRFITIPNKYSEGNKKYIILLDDLIRYNLSYIFRFFDYQKFKANTIKITRDGELDIDNDISRSFIEKISKGLKKRVKGKAVRLVYDTGITDNFLNLLKKLIGADKFDNFTPGATYHNKRDYMQFPNLGTSKNEYSKFKPLKIKGFDIDKSLLMQIKKKDYLLHTPYHDFTYLISFLKESALDPKVKTIKITLYRVAEESRVIKALINAARNGKRVIVQIELRARFDEAANIHWAEKMKSEGIELIFGIKGLKVHSKICVIERKESPETVRYGFVSTGNFNESTAKIYTDYTLFTANQSLLKDFDLIFDFFDRTYIINKYKHLIVSPHFTRSKFYSLIENEINKSKKGEVAFIKMRMNSLVDDQIIDALYKASQEGVKVKIVVRGICTLVPGIPNFSENIEVISIIDKFLEHPRLYIFANGGIESVYISSADLMRRNLDHRVEVTCPILDNDIKNEILDNFEIIWSDNTKSRSFNINQDNTYRKLPGTKVRTHFDTYKYYKDKLIKNKPQS